LTSITIGANVEIGLFDTGSHEVRVEAFDNTFDNIYNNNGRQAGTYTLNNGVWSLGGTTLQPAATPETNFTFENGTITKYNGATGTVVIPSQIQGQAVTKIGYEAFRDRNLKLSSIIIPNSVTEIGAGAFCDSSLTSIVIPDSVTIIREDAFSINPLTSITIGANVTLEKAAFETFVNNDLNDTFNEVYNNNGKQAGMYTLKNGVWTKQ